MATGAEGSWVPVPSTHSAGWGRSGDVLALSKLPPFCIRSLSKGMNSPAHNPVEPSLAPQACPEASLLKYSRCWPVEFNTNHATLFLSQMSQQNTVLKDER